MRLINENSCNASSNEEPSRLKEPSDVKPSKLLRKSSHIKPFIPKSLLPSQAFRDPLKELTTKDSDESSSNKSITSSPPKSICSSLSDNEEPSTMLEPTAEVEIHSFDPTIEFALTESDIERVFE